MTPPPTPFHIIRAHSAPLSTLSFNESNTLLYAGDQDGVVSIIDLRTRRAVRQWKAHDEGVLGVEEWRGQLLSQGRDNLIHLYEKQHALSSLLSGPGPSGEGPKIIKSLDVNALNFCRFSICRIPPTSGNTTPNTQDGTDNTSDKVGPEALLAVPNLTDSELADIYLLPSMTRLHAAINTSKVDITTPGAERDRTGLIMSLHLAFSPKGELSLVMGYEDGRVEVWRIPESAGSPNAANDEPAWRRKSDVRIANGESLWEKVWEAKGHNEAIMGMAVDSTISRAFTVSADHLICRYDLTKPTQEDIGGKIKSFNTGQIGNASIAISADDNVLAVGGWDGKIRLFSSGSLKPLGTLSYHRETVHTLAFAKRSPESGESGIREEASTLEIEGDDSDSDGEVAGGGLRGNWLASGGKDKRVALWALKDFSAG